MAPRGDQLGRAALKAVGKVEVLHRMGVSARPSRQRYAQKVLSRALRRGYSQAALGLPVGREPNRRLRQRRWIAAVTIPAITIPGPNGASAV
jgi:hypothetical protein